MKPHQISSLRKVVDDNSVDFAYIDDNHDYSFVNQDIQSWFPKVKTGGYLCGDDVYSLDMKDYDSDKNLIKIWSTNPPCCVNMELTRMYRQ